MKIRPLMRLCVLTVVLAAIPAPVLASAHQATPAGTHVLLPPDAEVDGATMSEWSARSWQWFFSLPAEINPFSDDTGSLCGYGQYGPVFFLAGADHDVERACVVPAGTHIFVPLIGSACSTVEPPPFFGEGEAGLRQCATDALNFAEGEWDMSVMRLAVDGVSLGDLSAYRAVTPLYTLWLPEDNVLGVPDRSADGVADGYQLMLAPLTVGEHTVEIVLPGPAGATTITYQLSVMSGA